MSKTFFRLADGNFSQTWTDITLLNVANDWSAVPSIMGFRGDGLAASGKDPRLVVADSTVVNAIVNQTNPNTNSTGGIAEFQIADAVVALQGSGTAQAPGLVLYLDATGRQGLHFSVDLRDIDGSVDNSVQQVVVQYRLGDTGNWTNVPNGYVADASSGPSLATLVSHLELDLPSAADNQAQVEIRIMTCDAAGSDEWIGIDNIAVTSQAMGADTTAPTLASSTPADGAVAVAAGADIVLNFSEQVALGSGNIVITDGAGDTRTIDVTDASQVSLSGRSVTVNPSANLHQGATYHVSVDAGAVHDVAGNAFAGTGANPVDFVTVPALTPIYTIQGAAHVSPLLGQLVHTSGVVTAIDTTSTKGFYIQDQSGDGNDATSDAIFVSSATTGAVKIGDLVDLMGTVDEPAGTGAAANNLSITQLVGVQGLTVLSSGNSVAPTVIGAGGRAVPGESIDSDHFAVFNPTVDAIDFYESLEGMLVTASNVQAVANSASGATFAILDNGAGASGANDRGGITRSAGDPNPERFVVYGDTGVNAGNTAVYTAGDKIGNVTGVLSYFGGNYELLPTVTPGAAVHSALVRESSTLAGDATHLSVAAYNLANLGPNDAQSKFDALAHDIAASLGGPDLLGVQELLDSSSLSADVTLGRLVAAIAAAGGPNYAYIAVDASDEGALSGAANGNVRSGVLYNVERVSYVEESVRLVADANLANGDAFLNSAHALTADFLFRGETVTYVGVDNIARTGSDELFGHNQPGVIGNEARRIDQSAAVGDFVHQLMHDNPAANVVVAGNFNAYNFETAVTALEAGGELHNLVSLLAANDRYSSAFEGNDEQTDQLLVSTNLAGGAQFDAVHINTNAAPGAVASDHDPLLARVFLNHAPVSFGDAYAASEDEPLVVDKAIGVLSNDLDQNGDALSATVVTAPEHGRLTLGADGAFSYSADANYNGEDSFSYSSSDGAGGLSAPVTVHLTIAAVNDAPTLDAAAPSAQLVEDGMNGAGVDSATVQLTRLDVDSQTDYANDGWVAEGDGLFSRDGVYGSALLDTVHDTVTYTLDNTRPATDALAAGAAVLDSFDIVVTDGASSSTRSVSFSVNGQNDAPHGRGDHAGAVEGAALDINVLANDGDVDGDALTLVLADAHSALGASVSIVDGKLHYVADAAAFDLLASGQAAQDSVTYSLQDASGASSGLISVAVTVAEAGDNLTSAVTDGDATVNLVREDAPIGLPVGLSGHATDTDSGATIRYSLQDDAGGRFAIDAVSGVVTLAAALDYEGATSHQVTIVATSANGAEPTSSSFTIAVANVDDNPTSQVFDANDASDTVLENAAIGTVVGITASAADLDGGASVSYALADDASGRFAINAATGVVTVAAALDFESAASHSITVVATSSDGSAPTRASMTIAIANVDDNATSAVVDSDSGPNTVSEDAAIGSAVGIAALASDADGGATIAYSLANDAGGRFAINPVTGVVSVAGALDFEAATSHAITVVATSSDGSAPTSAVMTVNLSNVDDNAIGLVTDANGAPNAVLENAAIGTPVGLTVSGVDLDRGAVVSYTLLDNAGGRFAIDAATGVVTVAGALDFESASSHDIIVVATSSDAGMPSSAVFTIGVRNVDDNPTSAISDTDNAANTVAEDAGIGSLVGVIANAVDLDSGATIAYSLQDSAGGKFAIDARSGVVSVAGALDFESATNHNITVLATSSDGSAPTSKVVNIAVTDVDEHAPVTISDSNSAANMVLEDAAVGALVGVTALAVAAAHNVTISYSLQDNAGGKFKIDAHTGVVSVAGALNYEAAPSHSITIVASGQDGVALGSKVMTIGVANVNEASTVTAGLSASGNEDGAIHGKLVATDPDGIVAYAVGAGAASQPANGKVAVNADGSYTYTPNPNFNGTDKFVVALTAGGFTELRTVTLTVNAVNDAPVISSNHGGDKASVNVAENTTAVTTVTASDVDAGATQTYSIVGGADAARFVIDAASGALAFKQAPNFEAPGDEGHHNDYAVKVQVSDGKLTDTQSITVHVTDVNEAPVITSNGGAASAAVTINENSAAVTTVRAADEDLVAGKVFSIAGGQDAAKFVIDARSGALAFKVAPDFEAKGSNAGGNVYDLVIKVSDGALSDTQALKVTVADVNEAPVIAGGDYAMVSFAENGSGLVAKLGAVDADAGTTLRYTIVASANGGGADGAAFTVDAAGNLRFAGAPNFEAPTDHFHNNTYFVTVKASDGSLSDYQTVRVAVSDVAAEQFVLTNGKDNFDLAHSGHGALQALGGDDTINAGAALKASDALDGGAGFDVLKLAGNYAAGLVFGAATVSNIEQIVLARGNSYTLTTAAATVAAGAAMTIDGANLSAYESMRVNAGAGVAGSVYKLMGGAGNDVLAGGAGNDVFTGGLGSDMLTGGLGHDSFGYASLYERGDRITDFTVGSGANADQLDLHAMFADVRGFSAANAFAKGYLQVVTVGADTLVQVDMNGLAGGHEWTTLVTLVGVSTADAATLVANNLVL
ncbi:MAG: cadherin domain-containing protein [Pseudomonadota bacterium]